MMQGDDAKIAAGLREEEKRLLAELGEEPGYVTQAFSMMRGPLGWPTMVLLMSQVVMFVAGVFFAIDFFAAETPLAALKSGLPAVTLILGSMIAKFAMWPQLHANRIIREMRRLEVQLLTRN
ncbi:DUF6768 family protein [Sphingomicrobium sediminis]|uniref:Uncharacterized protein n=1 Tax=Sphingomicrobium sediminis TaxID=2950949 RepID=A0A9X2J0N4_9SPHN|nr:DUF6768 family protein [Sphingomicrobium sediminis]MCM8556448.1 hypothetical protein [Sphingomicrobium sediminis]